MGSVERSTASRSVAGQRSSTDAARVERRQAGALEGVLERNGAELLPHLAVHVPAEVVRAGEKPLPAAFGKVPQESTASMGTSISPATCTAHRGMWKQGQWSVT